MTEKKKTNFWKWLGDTLLTILKDKAIKKTFDVLFAGAKFAGFKLWVAKVIVEVFWDYIGKPAAQLAERKGLFVYDKVDGVIKYKKLEEAKEESNEDDYNDIVDNA